jgi:hypothetical protein
MPRNFDQRNSRKKPMKTLASKTIDFACIFFILPPLGYNMESISMEKVLRNTGYCGKRLYQRHFEKTFKVYVKEGKTLRI